jgi:hypothetical protein
MLVKIIIIFIGFIFLSVLIEYIRTRVVRNKTGQPDESEARKLPEPEDEVCCGQHETCEKNLRLHALTNKAEYYDDEELDVYKSRSSDSYIDDEIAEFQEIIYTMRPQDVSGWLQSLQLRGIEVPDSLKDEVFMLIQEK